MTDKIVKFPMKKGSKKKPLNSKDIESIGFLTIDDRDLFIKDPASIMKIISFIIREKILILEDSESHPV